MIQLRSPLSLQSIMPFPVHSDQLGEKIRGNYQLIGMEVTAEELLHMTMLEPEIYVGMETGMTVLTENHVHIDNPVKLELVNQLINRILLYGTPQFTYQDEVFVAAVLQKMGITDVSGFMRQVKLQTDRNRLVTKLVSRYFEYGDEIAHYMTELIQHWEQDTTGSGGVRQQEDGVPMQVLVQNTSGTDLFLQNEIFERLQTAENNNTVYDYNHIYDNAQTARRGLQPVTWIEQADAIQLSQLRNAILYQKAPVAWQNIQTVFMQEDDSRSGMEGMGLHNQGVVWRIAAAALENLIQKISYESMQAPRGQQDWKDYTAVLYGSAAEAVERFRMFYRPADTAGYGEERQFYQSADTAGYEEQGRGRHFMDFARYEEIDSYHQSMKQLYENELQLAELASMNSLNININSDLNNSLNAETVHISDVWTSVLLSLVENQHLQKQVAQVLEMKEKKAYRTFEIYNTYRAFGKSETSGAGEGSGINEISGENEVYEMKETPVTDGTFMAKEESGTEEFWYQKIMAAEERYQEEENQFWQELYDKEEKFNQLEKIIQEAREKLLESVSKEERETLMQQVLQESHEKLLERLSQETQERLSEKDLREVHERLPERNSGAAQEGLLESGLQEEHEKLAVPADDILVLLEQYAGMEDGSGVPVSQNIDFLEQVNEHNLRMKELLENSKIMPDKTKMLVVDKTQAKKNTLKALENPDLILQEMYENGTAVDAINMPEEIETILSLTSQRTREFYEKAMGYHSTGADADRTVIDRAVMDKLGADRIDRAGMAMDRTEINRTDIEDIAIKGMAMDRTEINRTDIEDIAIKEMDRREINKAEINKAEKINRMDPERTAIDNIDKTVMDKTVIDKTAIDRAITDRAGIVVSLLLSQIEERDKSIRSDLSCYMEQAVGKASASREERDRDDAFYSYLSPLEETINQGMIYQKNVYQKDMYQKDMYQKDMYREIVHQGNAYQMNTHQTNTYQMNTHQEDMHQTGMYQENRNQINTHQEPEQQIIAHRTSAYQHEMSYAGEVYGAGWTKGPSGAGRTGFKSGKEPSGSVSLIHHDQEQLREEMLGEIREILEEEAVRQVHAEDKNKEKETHITQAQIQQMRQELIRHSEETVMQAVNRNLKTQIHMITDKVYHEMERRLKNEQRRRGY